ncbi:MAG TPA: hypothetical protein VIN36_04060 [Thiobacillus sp.]
MSAARYEHVLGVADLGAGFERGRVAQVELSRSDDSLNPPYPFVL